MILKAVPTSKGLAAPWGSAGRAESAEAGSKDGQAGRKYLQHVSQIQVAVSNMQGMQTLGGGIGNWMEKWVKGMN